MLKTSNLKDLVDKIRDHFRRWALYWVLSGVVLVLLLSVLTVTSAITGWPDVRGIFARDDQVKLKQDAKAVATEDLTKKLESRILPFATVNEINMTLYLPARLRYIKGIGYHESGNNKAFSLIPVGKCIKNENEWQVDVPLDSDCDIPKYYIMRSRGETTTATSVADVAMERKAYVLAPISGTVTKITPLIIYDQYDDVQIEVTPEGHPELRMAFLHIDDIRIKVGDTLKQGETIMGIPRDFTGLFESEIEDYIKPAYPHVHMQMNRYVPDEPPLSGAN